MVLVVNYIRNIHIIVAVTGELQLTPFAVVIIVPKLDGEHPFCHWLFHYCQFMFLLLSLLYQQLSLLC